jgi:hypothetical protein
VEAEHAQSESVARHLASLVISSAIRGDRTDQYGGAESKRNEASEQVPRRRGVSSSRWRTGESSRAKPAERSYEGGRAGWRDAYQRKEVGSLGAALPSAPTPAARRSPEEEEEAGSSSSSRDRRFVPRLPLPAWWRDGF